MESTDDLQNDVDPEEEKAVEGITTSIAKKRFIKHQRQKKAEKAALHEDFLPKEAESSVKPIDANDVTEVTQQVLLKHAPTILAAKKLDHRLQDGAVKVSFSRNGKVLCYGGSRGTLRTLNIQTQRPLLDLQVGHPIVDVKFMHQENFLSTAQRWVHIYDNQGVELHCFKQIYQPLALDFLPYHMLLVASSAQGFLSYLDVSTGDLVSHIATHRGRLPLMCQNPRTAVMCLAHKPGVVSLWAPSCAKGKPLGAILAHPSYGGVRALAVHPAGNYLATAGQERCIRLWDLRQIGANAVHELRLPGAACDVLTFSETGLLACAAERQVQILPDFVDSGTAPTEVHLSHSFPGNGVVTDLEFCPFEDVLACGRYREVNTLLVPGAASSSLDALESNPFESRRARKEREVRGLLQKVDYRLINMTAPIDQVYEGGLIEEAEVMKKAVMGFDRREQLQQAKAKVEKKNTKAKKKKKLKAQLTRTALFEKSAFVGKNTTYKQKQPFSKPPTGSALDRLIPKV